MYWSKKYNICINVPKESQNKKHIGLSLVVISSTAHMQPACLYRGLWSSRYNDGGASDESYLSLPEFNQNSLTDSFQLQLTTVNNI